MDSIHFSINKKFLAGILTLSALRSLQQDWWGRDETIRHVVNDWTTPWITVPIAIGFILIGGWLCTDPKPKPKDEEPDFLSAPKP